MTHGVVDPSEQRWRTGADRRVDEHRIGLQRRPLVVLDRVAARQPGRRWPMKSLVLAIRHVAGTSSWPYRSAAPPRLAASLAAARSALPLRPPDRAPFGARRHVDEQGHQAGDLTGVSA